LPERVSPARFERGVGARAAPLWDKGYVSRFAFQIHQKPRRITREITARALAVNRSLAIVIGASSGGVAALLELAAGLPVELNAVIGVVLHIGKHPSILPELLARRSAWPAIHPRDGQLPA